MKHEINFPDHSGEEYEKHLLAKQKAKEKGEESPALIRKINIWLVLGFLIAMTAVVAFGSFFDSEVAFFSCLFFVAVAAFLLSLRR